MISTLLGPEGTTGRSADRGCCFRTIQAWPGLAYRVREPALVGVVFLVAGVGLIGLWVGCWLRIAQWTRASLFSVG